MSNLFYAGFGARMAQVMLAEGAQLAAPEYKVVPVSVVYEFNTNHTEFADLTDVLGPPHTLTGINVVGNALFADDIIQVWEGISLPIHALVLYMETATETLLIGYIGLAVENTLPLTSGGQLVSVVWDTGGVFSV